MSGRDAAWLAGPPAALFACLAGMALGFAVDSRSVGLDTLVSLCRAAPVSLGASAAYHWELMRATLVGMVAGGLVASAATGMSMQGGVGGLCARLGFGLVCNLAMLAGMLLGGWLGPPLAVSLGIGWGPAALFVAMALGMVSGRIGLVLLEWVVSDCLKVAEGRIG